MLSKGDDFPIHQTPEPVAFAGTDRNFYDRYFFNGSRADGSGFFAVAFGVYPHLNVADAHISVLRGEEQLCLHASRELGMDFTRFTQAMRWSGSIEIDGKREEYGAGSVGVRDRSWGVREIGERDPQPRVPKEARQFYWLWAPTNFPNLALYYHANEDESGKPWNRRCLLAMDGAQ